MAVNMYNSRIYSLHSGGNAGVLFRDNTSGGDNGWIIGANDRGGSNPGDNCLHIIDGNPVTLFNDGWQAWYPDVNSDDSPSDVNLYVTFGQNSSMGIRTQNPQYTLHVNGNFYASGSSKVYKENIEPYDVDLNKIIEIETKKFDYKEQHKKMGRRLKSGYQIGVIAEEIEQVLPELAITINEIDTEVTRNADYEKMSVVLLCAYKQLKKRVEKLKEKVYGQ